MKIKDGYLALDGEIIRSEDVISFANPRRRSVLFQFTLNADHVVVPVFRYDSFGRALKRAIKKSVTYNATLNPLIAKHLEILKLFKSIEELDAGLQADTIVDCSKFYNLLSIFYFATIDKGTLERLFAEGGYRNHVNLPGIKHPMNYRQFRTAKLTDLIQQYTEWRATPLAVRLSAPPSYINATVIQPITVAQNNPSDDLSDYNLLTAFLQSPEPEAKTTPTPLSPLSLSFLDDFSANDFSIAPSVPEPEPASTSVHSDSSAKLTFLFNKRRYDAANQRTNVESHKRAKNSNSF